MFKIFGHFRYFNSRPNHILCNVYISRSFNDIEFKISSSYLISVIDGIRLVIFVDPK